MKNTKCPLCDILVDAETMLSVPKALTPAAHILFACKQYVRRNMYLFSLKFFIGPILAIAEVKGSSPVCRTCHRVTILSSVALYILIAGCVGLAIFGK